MLGWLREVTKWNGDQNCGMKTVILGICKLVGGFNPSEKYYIISWDDYSQYMEK